jgi:hypothetical protein
MTMIETTGTEFVNVDAAIGRWQCFPASSLSHHGGRCCEIAREWVLAMDRSQLNGAPALTGPRWLRNKYTWGPSRWPNHWCEAVGEKTLDCGALAALTHEIFTARGVRSYPAQFIQQYSSEDTCHWNQKWGDKQCTVNWIEDELIYHEGCAVVVSGREVKLWDATASWWLNPRRVGGYGGLLAARIITPPADSGEVFKWGRHALAANRWQKVEQAPEAAEAASAEAHA